MKEEKSPKLGYGLAYTIRAFLRRKSAPSPPRRKRKTESVREGGSSGLKKIRKGGKVMTVGDEWEEGKFSFLEGFMVKLRFNILFHFSACSLTFYYFFYIDSSTIILFSLKNNFP